MTNWNRNIYETSAVYLAKLRYRFDYTSEAVLQNEETERDREKIEVESWLEFALRKLKSPANETLTFECSL